MGDIEAALNGRDQSPTVDTPQQQQQDFHKRRNQPWGGGGGVEPVDAFDTGWNMYIGILFIVTLFMTV